MRNSLAPDRMLMGEHRRSDREGRTGKARCPVWPIHSAQSLFTARSRHGLCSQVQNHCRQL